MLELLTLVFRRVTWLDAIIGCILLMEPSRGWFNVRNWLFFIHQTNVRFHSITVPTHLYQALHPLCDESA